MTAPRCIINVSVNHWYPKGQDRLVRSLIENGYDGDMLLWTDYSPRGPKFDFTRYPSKGQIFQQQGYPPDSPTHEEVPYAFKIYAYEEAKRRGYESVVWCDASVWFVASPAEVFQRVDRDGYYFFAYPNRKVRVGHVCADHALSKLKITREEAMEIPISIGTFNGLSLRSLVGIQILDWMGARARDGSFVGDWTNEKGQVSSDRRVKGHRHDQTAWSVIRYKLSLEQDSCPGLFALPSHPLEKKTNIVVLAQGM